MSLEMTFVFSMNSGARSFAAFAVLANHDPNAFAAVVALDKRLPSGSSGAADPEPEPRRGDDASGADVGDETESLFENDEVVVKLNGAVVESSNVIRRSGYETYMQAKGLLPLMVVMVRRKRKRWQLSSAYTNHTLSCYTFAESVMTRVPI
jgi:hypothetical protein